MIAVYGFVLQTGDASHRIGNVNDESFPPVVSKMAGWSRLVIVLVFVATRSGAITSLLWFGVEI